MRTLSFSSYLKVPRDFETIIRSIRRKFHGGYQEKHHDYISGDSFKSQCDLELNEENWQHALASTIENRDRSFIFFLSGAPKSQVAFELTNYFQTTNKFFFPNVSLVLHNGDVFPETLKIEQISNFFRKIYAVNWVGNSSNVVPIPIGLENEGYLLNGVLDDYLSMRSKLKPWNTRTIDYLVCFSINTNPVERSSALHYAKQARNVFIVEKPITPKRYRELVANSKYVISPPGNGIDCHRTWESLFLGSVPIVKRKFWPFDKYEIGVQVLNDWNEIGKSANETLEINPSFFYNKYSKIQDWLV